MIASAMTTLAACTLATPRFIAAACLAAESFREQHPGIPTYGLLVGERDDFPGAERLPFQALRFEDLVTPPAASQRFRYDERALSCSLKASLLETLDRRFGVECALYLDADTWVLSPLGEILKMLERHPMVLFPVLGRAPRQPVVSPDGLLRRSGILSSGMFALRFTSGTRSFLDFWQRQLVRAAVHDPWLGILHDQTWFDFAVCFVDDVKIVRDRCYHLGYWNLDGGDIERSGEDFLLDGSPVRVFHASGFDPAAPERISGHLARDERQVTASLAPLVARYAERLSAVAVRWSGRSDLSPFSRFRGVDVPIPESVRQLYDALDPCGERWSDPFDSAGADSFYAFLRAPVRFPAGTLNQAALALWESRSDLLKAFPDPCGEDLAAFVAWLLDHGEARRAGFDERLLAGVSATPTPTTEDVDMPPVEPLRAAREIARDPRAVLLGQLTNARESATGDWWIDQGLPFTGAIGDGAVSRLAMLVHRHRPDVQIRFPDPAGADRVAFAGWLAEIGALELARGLRRKP